MQSGNPGLNDHLNASKPRSLRCGVLKEVLRLLLFINGTLLDVQNGKTQVKSNLKSSELSFLTPTTPGFEEKAPFSGRFFYFTRSGKIQSLVVLCKVFAQLIICK